MNTPSADQGFSGLGIAPRLLETLTRVGYHKPTPIQHQAIPPAIEGKDLIGIAQTGTGKTLAFGIPTLQRLAVVKGQALIVLPTRELALQVEEALQKIGQGSGLRTAVLIGGASMGNQVQSLRRKPHILVVTPGRLIDHLEQKYLTLDQVRILILDEADRMLDMGFAPQINRILVNVPKDRQTMLFSATMPDAISRIASKHMKIPLRIEIARAGTVADRVEQEVYFIGKEAKTRLLAVLLDAGRGSTLVFTRTKHGAKKLVRQLITRGYSAAEIHSNRTLAQRRAALDGFKSGRYRVLVATDIAARGIDVQGIELVVNYDLPDNPDDYVHRIGRTGRAGLAGKAVSFATFDQRADVKTIERVIRAVLPVAPLPEMPYEVEAPPTDQPPRQTFQPRHPGVAHAPRRPHWQNRNRNRGNRR